MLLSSSQAGPYVRALRAGLRALAPDEDYPPLAAMDAHLAALDPALCGDLLSPAELDDGSGLPAFTWMDRARAEQAIASGPVPASALAHARALSASLGERLTWRARLHAHLRSHTTMPGSGLSVRVRLMGADTTEFVLAYDRQLPGRGWLRLRASLSGPAGWQGRMLSLRADGTVLADPGLRHLLGRHCVDPLVALRSWLSESLSVAVPRLSRSFVGPFWTPLLPLPEGAPATLAGGLVLHLATEVLSRDVAGSVIIDPYRPSPGLAPPAGFGLYCERRFAASAGVVSALRAWAGAQDLRIFIAPLTTG